MCDTQIVMQNAEEINKRECLCFNKDEESTSQRTQYYIGPHLHVEAATDLMLDFREKCHVEGQMREVFE